MSQWYAIRTATRCETKAAAALGEAGVTVFLPMEADWGYRAGVAGKIRVERPLLRGYLFVLLEDLTGLAMKELGDAIAPVLGVDYVHDFLGCLDPQGVTRPLPIPFRLIIELQTDELAGHYDGTLYTKPKYRPRKGDKVRATSGTWLGWFGKVISTPKGERAHVMFEGPFGRGAIVQASHLSPAA